MEVSSEVWWGHNGSQILTYGYKEIFLKNLPRHHLTRAVTYVKASSVNVD